MLVATPVVPPGIALRLCVALVALLVSMTGFAQTSTASPASSFTYTLSDDGKRLALSGPIDFGATEQLSQLLDVSPGITHLQLTSNGGRVAEARGLVRVIELHQLSTSAVGDCTSSCTLAFMAGHERGLEPGARLGFHRYRQSSQLLTMFMNSSDEQEKDMAIFRRKEVAESFLAKILETPPENVWYPSRQELLEAGVLTDPKG